MGTQSLFMLQLVELGLCCANGQMRLEPLSLELSQPMRKRLKPKKMDATMLLCTRTRISFPGSTLLHRVKESMLYMTLWEKTHLR